MSPLRGRWRAGPGSRSRATRQECPLPAPHNLVQISGAKGNGHRDFSRWPLSIPATTYSPDTLSHHRRENCGLVRVPLTHQRRRSEISTRLYTVTMVPCVCAPCWVYSVRAGVEPAGAAPALPDRHCPAGGLCSLLVAATTYSSPSNN